MDPAMQPKKWCTRKMENHTDLKVPKRLQRKVWGIDYSAHRDALTGKFDDEYIYLVELNMPYSHHGECTCGYLSKEEALKYIEEARIDTETWEDEYPEDMRKLREEINEKKKIGMDPEDVLKIVLKSKGLNI